MYDKNFFDILYIDFRAQWVNHESSDKMSLKSLVKFICSKKLEVALGRGRFNFFNILFTLSIPESDSNKEYSIIYLYHISVSVSYSSLVN